jgi:transcriptional regulator with XRE-family HTH domain
LIRTERVRAKLTPKQLAKKCGVAESYIVAVEKGTKIIADDQARRILKSIGLREQTEADFSLDDIAATVDLATVGSPVAKTVATRPAPKQEPEAELVASTGGKAPSGSKNLPDNEDKNVGGSIWLDALTSVLKHVPVMNAIMKPIDHRLLPIVGGKIEGANPDKVFYYLAPDDSMRGFRILRDNICLIVPSNSPIDGAVMLVEYNQHRFIGKVKKLDAMHILLQSYDREYNAETVAMPDVNFVGRVVRVEFTL